jgi:hypothetical protein
MTNCPFLKKSQPVASYIRSAGKGLSFYHIDLPDDETTWWLNITNCGIVVIKSGSLIMSELEKDLSDIFCKNWP